MTTTKQTKSARSTVQKAQSAAKRQRAIARQSPSAQCEVLSLTGDVAVGTDDAQLHVGAVLGLADGRTRGGHLLEGRHGAHRRQRRP